MEQLKGSKKEKTGERKREWKFAEMSHIGRRERIAVTYTMLG